MVKVTDERLGQEFHVSGDGIFGQFPLLHLVDHLLLAQIPIVQSICEGGDDGAPAATKVDSITGQAFLSLAQSVVTVVNRRNAEKAPTKIVSTH